MRNRAEKYQILNATLAAFGSFHVTLAIMRAITEGMNDMAYKEPTTKADLLNAMLSIDFSGDLRDLDPERALRIQRLRRNAISLTFGSGQTFELVVRKPRGEPIRAVVATKKKATVGKAAHNGDDEVENTNSTPPPSARQKGGTRRQQAEKH